jgi:hypothetical protein
MKSRHQSMMTQERTVGAVSIKLHGTQHVQGHLKTVVGKVPIRVGMVHHFNNVVIHRLEKLTTNLVPAILTFLSLAPSK